MRRLQPSRRPETYDAHCLAARQALRHIPVMEFSDSMPALFRWVRNWAPFAEMQFPQGTRFDISGAPGRWLLVFSCYGRPIVTLPADPTAPDPPLESTDD